MLSIGLYEWEVIEMRKLAGKQSFSLMTKPTFVLYDVKSKLAFSEQWNLDYSDCPFFSNNSCTINLKKPLVCQAYPLYLQGIFSEIEERKEVGTLDCDNAVLLPFRIDKATTVSAKALFPFLLNTYGTSFLGALKACIVMENYRRFLRFLKERGLVEPAPVPHEIIKSTLRNKFQPLGLIEFTKKIDPTLGAHFSNLTQATVNMTKESLEKICIHPSEVNTFLYKSSL